MNLASSLEHWNRRELQIAEIIEWLQKKEF